MVRAILADQKTVTRRPVTLQEFNRSETPGYDWTWRNARALWEDYRNAALLERKCPYGKAGDELWVRETWRAVEQPDSGVDGVLFAADGAFRPIANTADAAEQWVAAYNNGQHGTRWRPSIFMPRWASRITLRIASVRVERLQDITEEDARAEGCSGRDPEPVAEGGTIYCWKGRSSAPNPRAHFHHVWTSLHGEKSWDENQWVWRIEFWRLEGQVSP